MAALRAMLARFVDLRRDEIAPLVKMSAALFLLIAAHTTLETARDALVLSSLPPRQLGFVYVAVALCVLPIAAVSARVSVRMGPRRSLLGGLVTAALALVALHTSPSASASVVLVYVATGLVAAILLPLFWTLFGAVFTVSQGRRLVGPIGAAGTLGGVAGSLLAVGALRVIPVQTLLVVSAAMLAVAAFVLPTGPSSGLESLGGEKQSGTAESTGSLIAEPFVRRIALLVASSTTALLVLDFYFKWSVARSIRPDSVAPFIATYYAALNAAALVVQVAASRPLVRRYGVTSTGVVLPFVLFCGAVPAVLSGGPLAFALVLKALDGGLRTSVHRPATELIYLPLPAATRARAKPLIDGALTRVVQGAGGALLLAAGVANLLSSSMLAAAALLSIAWWLGVAWTTRTPYLALLRRTIAAPTTVPASTPPDALDIESAEVLVGYLSDEDPTMVVGAMNALVRRGRDRLVPAIILLHGDETVLTRALALFSVSPRQDWLGYGHKLLADRREGVRMAAARALASHGSLQGKELSFDASPRAHGYAAASGAIGDDEADPSKVDTIREMLELAGEAGEQARLGLLSAIADRTGTACASNLLGALAALPDDSNEWRVELSRAAKAQRAKELLPLLVSLLVFRASREAVRMSIISFGADALHELGAALVDGSKPRALRVHIPNTLQRFGTPEAAAILLDALESNTDGLVRYKALRALGRLVAKGSVTLDRQRVERLALANLTEHVRLLALRVRLEASPHPASSDTSRAAATERILVGLLDDKLGQALERTFRLLKIAHPVEDLHRMHDAFLSNEKRLRDSAAEFLDTHLFRRDQARLRALLRTVAEDLSTVEALERARERLPHSVPATREAVLSILAADRDAMLAALTRLHLAAAAGAPATIQIGSRERAPVELVVESVATGA